MSSLQQKRDEYIVACAEFGLTTKEIQTMLLVELGEVLSMRQLQRIRKQHGVENRRDESPINLVQEAIEKELNGPGSLLGYRSMWYRLRYKYKLNVRRDTVMILLALMDPCGTAQRKRRKLKRRIYRSKGPNFLWHCDGYDKLKPFGIAIHGCIDGYSRKMLWLHAATTNNDPRCIAKYFVDCVKENGGCPQVLRTDRGTENSILAMIQPMLRHNHDDSFAQERSHIYGRSTSNQKIEAWWCHLRKHHMEWWITFFKDLQNEGHFNSCIPHHMDAIRFSFGNLIQKELNNFIAEWNHHRIRYSSMAELPSGIPQILYDCPVLHGIEDRICPVDEYILTEIEESYCVVPAMVGPEFGAIAESIMQEYSLTEPNQFEEGLELYHTIVSVLDQMLIDF